MLPIWALACLAGCAGNPAAGYASLAACVHDQFFSRISGNSGAGGGRLDRSATDGSAIFAQAILTCGDPVPDLTGTASPRPSRSTTASRSGSTLRRTPGRPDRRSASVRAATRLMAMIPVTPRISLDEAELGESFLRASGAGGQNVNKVETAVQLRFDARHSRNLPEPVRARLERLAGRRLTRDGVIVITAQRHRTRERNRVDALERLIALIREAAAPPPPMRRATRPTLGSRTRRLDGKVARGNTKRLRGPPEDA